MAKGDTLTPQQEQFCQEFIKDLAAVPAAIRAGYGEQHAKKNAWTMIRNPLVAKRISELKNRPLAIAPITRNVKTMSKDAFARREEDIS